jgi:hypothetical protein
MDNSLQIILDVQGTRFYLDTTGIETIPLTFNVADIKDISVTKGSFSKTITVPETPNNRAIFNNISDLNSMSTFDPNLRNRAYILVNTIMVIDGYFQLTNIVNDLNNHYNGLSLVIYTDNNDFYIVLAEQLIETLNITDLDHYWNESNIVGSWNNDFTNGYYYPLIDYGYNWTTTSINGSIGYPPSGYGTFSGVVTDAQMMPSVYVRRIWDQIIKEAGFSWTSNSLTQSTPFDNLIIPMNTNQINVSQEFIQDNIFRVGLTATQSILGATYSYEFPGPSYIPPVAGSSGFFTSVATSRVDFNNENPPNGDPNNKWSTTFFEWTNTATYSVSQRFGLYMVIEQLHYYCPADSAGNSTYPKLQLKRTYDPTGYTTPGGYNQQTCDLFPSETFLPVSASASSVWTKYVSAPFGRIDHFEKQVGMFYSPTLNYKPGEKVWLEYTFQTAGRGDYDYILPTSPPFDRIWHLNGGYITAKIDPQSYIFNEISPIAIPNQLISMKSTLPKQIKRKDFMLSIIKMFNLVVYPSKDEPKTLVIETRNSFYKNGVIKDWSNKVDLNTPIEITVLGDTSAKKTILKYKDDKDYYNTDYTTRTKLGYGEYQYITSNEMVTGEKKIEVIFSPTPIVAIPKSTNPGSTQSSIVIPKIVTLNNGVLQYTNSNIRILQKKYLTNLADTWKLNSTSYNSYPYSGSVDDPFNPTIDINFGQTTGLYYPQTNVTNNNLYTTYWKQMLDEISDGESRIVTMSLYLTSQDIYQFNFSDNIFIDLGNGGQYYKVNKIEGYDPSTISTCKVEFILTQDITVPKQIQIYTGGSTWNPSNGLIGAAVENYTINNNLIFDSQTVVLGPANTITDTGIVVGASNNSSGLRSLIVGNTNNTSSDGTLIIGDNSVVGSGGNRSRIIGSNTTVGYGVSDSMLIGDNNLLVSGETQSSSGVYMMGNNNILNNNVLVFTSSGTYSGYYNENRGLTNSIIIGYGLTQAQSNTTYLINDTTNIISNVININGVTISATALGIWDQPHLGSARVAGNSNVAGTYSLVAGDFNTSNGIASIVTGISNTDNSNANLISGQSNLIDYSGSGLVGSNGLIGGSLYTNGNGNLIGGYQNKAYGEFNVIVGQHNIATGSNCLIAGSNNYMVGPAANNNAIVGYNNIIDNISQDNFISGSNNIITSFGSDGNLVGGILHIVNGTYNMSSGAQNIITGSYNMSSGVINILNGNYNFISGGSNGAKGSYNFISGYTNYIIGNHINIFGTNITGTVSNTTYVEDLRLWNKNSVYYKSSATNPTAGTVTLVAGSATVNTTSVQTSSIILLTVQGGTLTNVGAQYISARTAGTSFTISSLNVLDTSTVGWVIIGTY